MAGNGRIVHDDLLLKGEVVVDHIPVLWYAPRNLRNKADDQRHVVIWLPGFGGSKEAVSADLIRLASEGYLAVSFDPAQHGARRISSQEELVERVRGNIRKYFWPILTLTAEEFPRMIDWALDEFSIAGRVMAGGISMGGDIAVAAGSVDTRISVISACIATADWLRPNSHEPPGHADVYAAHCYQRRNPLTHPELYAHRPFISFQCGDLDRQVPAEGAEAFREVLSPVYGDEIGRIQVNRLAGVQHAYTEEMAQHSLKWFNLHRGVQ